MKPLAQQPKYQAAIARHDRLAQAEAKIARRLQEIQILLRDRVRVSDGVHVDAALAFAESGVQVSTLTAVSCLQDEHSNLSRQREALQATLRASNDAIYSIAQELSQLASRESLAAQRRIVEKSLAALRALNAAHEEERSLIASLNEQGFDVRFPCCVAWPVVGSVAEGSSSSLWHRIRELERYLS